MLTSYTTGTTGWDNEITSTPTSPTGLSEPTTSPPPTPSPASAEPFAGANAERQPDQRHERGRPAGRHGQRGDHQRLRGRGPDQLFEFLKQRDREVVERHRRRWPC